MKCAFSAVLEQSHPLEAMRMYVVVRPGHICRSLSERLGRATYTSSESSKPASAPKSDGAVVRRDDDMRDVEETGSLS